jgi:mannitol-specific phosphotransferase system IIBC component
MDMLVLLMGLVIGLLAGFALAYLLLKGKGENQISVANERNRLLDLAQAELKNQLSQQQSDAQNQLKAERTKIESLSSSLAKSEAEKK